MNGAHDCGGMMGYGPVRPEADEPVFHARWEARMFALMSAAGDVGGWSIDEDRAACEAMHPLRYVETSYYEHWLSGLERLLEKHPPMPGVTPTRAPEVWGLVSHAGSYRRQAAAPARFAVGGKVRTRNIHPEGHTRLPRYLRGHIGEIVAVHGANVFPDSHAAGRGEDPHWLYTVRFAAAEVWGSPSRHLIHADLWEPYLEAC